MRFVNSSVTVRVGGGWKTLEEFFDSNDPCRGRLNPSVSCQVVYKHCLALLMCSLTTNDNSNSQQYYRADIKIHYRIHYMVRSSAEVMFFVIGHCDVVFDLVV